MTPEQMQAMIDTLENAKTQLADVKVKSEQEHITVQVQFSYNGGVVNGQMPKRTADAIAQWVQMFN